MPTLHRRGFLGASLGGLAAALSFGPAVFAEVAGSDTFRAGRNAKPFDPDTLFLSWQRDPTTTMMVQWVGPAISADTSIQYAPLENSVWQIARTITKPYPNTELLVHRCELTGLVAGSEYQFQIGKASPTFRFRTMPAKATNAIQFVSGGDCGINEHAIGTNILAARQEPYFALIGGDLAYDNGRSPETFTQFLRNYRAHMVDPVGRLIPMLSCIGNHEVDGAYKMARSQSPQFLSVFDGLFPEKTFRVLDIGNYLSLVLLDTDHVEPIGGEQTDWLARTLADRQERPHLIVANHVPAYPSYRAPEGQDGKSGTGEEQRRHWSPLFEKY
ncbi:MAG: metallophosphoesterase family protein [Planctomycetaceae bacterium]|nr:metallophosphoesterase family protein [Planctomycetaceae bacterium]